jgi:hypothetical protein
MQDETEAQPLLYWNTALITAFLVVSCGPSQSEETSYSDITGSADIVPHHLIYICCNF